MSACNAYFEWKINRSPATDAPERVYGLLLTLWRFTSPAHFITGYDTSEPFAAFGLLADSKQRSCWAAQMDHLDKENSESHNKNL